MMANEPKARIQAIQVKIDALKKKREAKLAKADGVFDKTRREALNRHNKSYKKVMVEFDPKLAKLEEKRRTAEREARQVWEELQKPKKPSKGYPVIVFLGHSGWGFFLFPVVARGLILVLIVWAYNNAVRKTPCPLYW